jgi:H+/Cl- antiporter ClcA
MEQVTRTRWEHPWLLGFLPLIGLAMGWMYHHYGKVAERGNNLIIEEIHQPGGGVPRRMAPLILVSTWLTHLGGGSAGREGTAVQMGGSLASALMHWVPLDPKQRRRFLQAGMAAGFGGVFGTPWAGAIFAIEVRTLWRYDLASFLPCLFASLLSDQVCRAWGIHHLMDDLRVTVSPSAVHGLQINGRCLLAALLSAVVFGAVATLFARLLRHGSALVKRWIPSALWRPVLGGVLVIGLFFLAGTPDYLGLGDRSSQPGGMSIQACFTGGIISPWAWVWKFLFTLVTLASGYKGGEVTPLFFIGATLGHMLAGPLGLPVALGAALGLIGVFSGAAHTPLACVAMGIELFGFPFTLYYGVVAYVSSWLARKPGLYSAQKIPEQNAE